MQTLNLPPAHARPPGSTTIGTTIDERQDLREGMILIAVGCVLGGMTLGYFVGRKSRPKTNPACALPVPTNRRR